MKPIHYILIGIISLIIITLIIWLSSYTIVPVEIAVAPTPTPTITPTPTLTPEQTLKQNTKAYKDPIAGLSFRYPLNWQVSGVKPGSSALLTYQTLDDIQATIQLQITPATQSLNAYASQIPGETLAYPLRPSIPGTKVFNQEAGQITYIFIFENKLYQFILTQNNTALEATQSAETINHDTTLNDIIATIELTPQKKPDQ